MVSTALSLVEFGAGGVAVAVSLIALQHREKPAGLPVVCMALAGAGWALGSALQPITTSYRSSLVLRNFTYLMTDFVSVSWLYISAEYAGREWFKRKPVLAVLLGLIVGGTFAMVTNLFGGFYMPGTTVTPEGAFVHQEGSVFWLVIFWNYAVILIGMVILAVEIKNRTGMYRKQAAAVLFSGMVPSVAAFIEVSGIVDIPGFNLSTVGVAISAVVLLWALFYMDFLKVPSVAKRTLMESMDDAVIAFDSKKRIIDANEHAMDLFGFGSDVIGEPAEAVFGSYQGFLDEVSGLGTESYFSFGADGDSGDIVATRRSEIRMDMNGETRYYDIKISSVVPANSGVSLFTSGKAESLGFLFVIRDVTERKRRQKRLRRKNERLDQFASLVSHDLRNPLNVAIGEISLAEKGEPDSFEKVRVSLERIDDIIDDMLSLARSEATVEEVDDVSLITRAHIAWETSETGEATLEVDLDEEKSIYADTNLLQNIFENLFRNSVEHNGEAVTVRVGTLTDADGGFYVEDDGKGIPEDEREDVFEYGYTKSKEGSGLGLAIVEDLIEAHGWEITATEGKDGGARFEIRT